MYKSLFINPSKKDFKKLDYEIQKFIRYSCIPEILDNPYSCPNLRGKSFKKYFKYLFRKKRVDYRVIYTINEESKTVVFVMFNSRENSYKKLKQRI